MKFFSFSNTTFFLNSDNQQRRMSSLPDDLKKDRKLTYGESFYENITSKKRPRLVKKCGELNIQMKNVANHKLRLFKDFFNTIIGNL